LDCKKATDEESCELVFITRNEIFATNFPASAPRNILISRYVKGLPEQAYLAITRVASAFKQAYLTTTQVLAVSPLLNEAKPYSFLAVTYCFLPPPIFLTTLPVSRHRPFLSLRFLSPCSIIPRSKPHHSQGLTGPLCRGLTSTT
jgi:hypothetical protein